MAYESPGPDVLNDPQSKRSGWLRQAALDLVMAGLVLGFVAFRRWVPEMTTTQLDGSGAEKFANAMIFWTSWQAQHLPPEDAWFAGNTLNYYYWGHWQWAWAARLGGFPPLLALNLTYAVAVTWVWTAAYLLGRAARLPMAWAAAAGVCVTWGGNPDALVRLKAAIVSWWPFHGKPAVVECFLTPASTIGGPRAPSPTSSMSSPPSVRFLAIITPHHLALPWLTGWLALAVGGRRWVGARLGSDTVLAALAWVALGAAAVLTNLWNLPLIGFGMAVAAGACAAPRPAGFCHPVGHEPALGRGAAARHAPVARGTHRCRSPAPKPRPSGIASRSGFCRRKLRTPPANLFGMWGFPMLVFAIGAAANLVRRGRMRNAECGMRNKEMRNEENAE